MPTRRATKKEAADYVEVDKVGEVAKVRRIDLIIRKGLGNTYLEYKDSLTLPRATSETLTVGLWA